METWPARDCKGTQSHVSWLCGPLLTADQATPNTPPPANTVQDATQHIQNLHQPTSKRVLNGKRKLYDHNLTIRVCFMSQKHMPGPTGLHPSHRFIHRGTHVHSCITPHNQRTNYQFKALTGRVLFELVLYSSPKPSDPKAQGRPVCKSQILWCDVARRFIAAK